MSEDICPKHRSQMYQPECSRCDGEGLIEDRDDFDTFRPTFVRCWSCGGSGVVPWKACEECEYDARDEEIREEMAV